MEKSKLNSFLKRLATSLVLVPAVVYCIISRYPAFELLVLLGAALLSWEWANMMPNKRPSFYALAYFFVAAVTLILGSFGAAAVSMFAALGLAFVKSKDEKHRWLLLLGIPYISVGLGAIGEISVLYGSQMVLWYVFLIWAVDIGGYLFGCTIKGPKLAPKISPNKTWAGLIGGMILASVVSFAVCWYFDVRDTQALTEYVVMAALLAVIAQIGDLIESAIKRHLGLKDSSNMIPGHGGIFDRVDGLIFAAPFAVLMLKNLFRFY